MLQGILLPQPVPMRTAGMKEEPGVESATDMLPHHFIHRDVPRNSAAVVQSPRPGIIGSELIDATRDIIPDRCGVGHLEIRRSAERVDDREIGTQPHRTLLRDEDRLELVQGCAGSQRQGHQFPVPGPGHPEGIRPEIVGQVVGDGETGLVDAGIGFPAGHVSGREQARKAILLPLHIHDVVEFVGCVALLPDHRPPGSAGLRRNDGRGTRRGRNGAEQQQATCESDNRNTHRT